MSNQPQAHVADIPAEDLPCLPDALEEVSAKFRGEFDHVAPGDNYYTASMMFAYGRACIAAARAAIPAGANGIDDIAFNAQRLRNVAKLVGVNLSTVNDETVDGSRGALLGEIAAKLRAAGAPAETAKPVAPWPDFNGALISHGARLVHPDGSTFVAIRLDGYDEESDAWRAVYDHEPQMASRLCLQIGDKGQAVLSGAAQPAPAPATDAMRDVLAERQRQQDVEGWTPAHDDAYRFGELGVAALCYLRSNRFSGPIDAPIDSWPWPHEWWKPTTRRRNLVKAGALIIAEIERIDRAAMLSANSPREAG